MGNLNGKVIVVTGGTSGIGLACCEHFARQGASVVAVSIQSEEGRILSERLTAEGHRCSFFPADVSSEDEVRAAINFTRETLGKIDAVHSNAGVLRSQKITELTVEDFHLLINVNLLGAALITKHAVPIMQEQGRGVICYTTSVAADIGFPEHGIYAASKAAIVAMMRSLVTDHSPEGIRFVAVSPGTIDTPMLAASCEGWAKPKEELYADVAAKIPVRRLGQPDDVARIVAFLFGEDAEFINGTVIGVEGGTLALPPW